MVVKTQIISVTPQQLRVARAFCVDGAANKILARRLHLSEETIKTHLRHLFLKTRTSDRAALAVAIWSGRIDLKSRTCESLRSELKKLLVGEQFIVP